MACAGGRRPAPSSDDPLEAELLLLAELPEPERGRREVVRRTRASIAESSPDSLLARRATGTAMGCCSGDRRDERTEASGDRLAFLAERVGEDMTRTGGVLGRPGGIGLAVRLLEEDDRRLRLRRLGESTAVDEPGQAESQGWPGSWPSTPPPADAAAGIGGDSGAFAGGDTAYCAIVEGSGVGSEPGRGLALPALLSRLGRDMRRRGDVRLEERKGDTCGENASGELALVDGRGDCASEGGPGAAGVDGESRRAVGAGFAAERGGVDERDSGAAGMEMGAAGNGASSDVSGGGSAPELDDGEAAMLGGGRGGGVLGLQGGEHQYGGAHGDGHQRTTSQGNKRSQKTRRASRARVSRIERDRGPDASEGAASSR